MFYFGHSGNYFSDFNVMHQAKTAEHWKDKITTTTTTATAITKKTELNENETKTLKLKTIFKKIHYYVDETKIIRPLMKKINE